jgi:hypothetical protein
MPLRLQPHPACARKDGDQFFSVWADKNPVPSGLQFFRQPLLIGKSQLIFSGKNSVSQTLSLRFRNSRTKGREYAGQDWDHSQSAKWQSGRASSEGDDKPWLRSGDPVHALASRPAAPRSHSNLCLVISHSEKPHIVEIVQTVSGQLDAPGENCLI